MKEIHYFLIIFCLALTGCNNRTANSGINAEDGLVNRRSDPAEVKIIKQDWVEAMCELLCDDQKGKFLDPTKLKKHGKWLPYDTIQSTNQELITVSFDFISDCCREFEGTASLKSDTLNLMYGDVGNTAQPCDCYCDYRMIYKIKKSKTWSKIVITNLHGHKSSKLKR